MSDTIIVAIITGVVSLLTGFIGGATTVLIVSRKTIKQKQFAKDGANQVQLGIKNETD